MENEIMNYEDEVMEVEAIEAEAENPGMSTGMAMAVGGLLTLAGVAIVKTVKKLVAKHKAKKELKLVEEGDEVEVTEEQIMEVTK